MNSVVSTVIGWIGNVAIMHNINCPHQLEGYLVKRSEMHNRDLRDSTLLHVI